MADSEPLPKPVPALLALPSPATDREDRSCAGSRTRVEGCDLGVLVGDPA